MGRRVYAAAGRRGGSGTSAAAPERVRAGYEQVAGTANDSVTDCRKQKMPKKQTS